MNTIIRAHLALLATNLLYGANYEIAKGVMPEFIGPSGFILVRVAFGFASFWVISVFTESEKIHKSDIFRLILCGITGIAINQLFFFEGLTRTTTINAALIMTTNPVLVLLLAGIFLRESLSGIRITGIVLGISGAIFLILHGNSVTIGQGTFTGDVFIFLNALSYGIYLILAKPLMAKYKPLTVIRWVFTIGLVFVMPFGMHEFSQIKWSGMSAGNFGSVLYVVIGATVLAYLLNIYALQKVNASVVSFYIYLQPLFATLIAMVLGTDNFSWVHAVSAFVIFAGVFMVSKPSRGSIANAQ
jgi:drug/metabolite transporter (DMT)-like permease